MWVKLFSLNELARSLRQRELFKHFPFSPSLPSRLDLSCDVITYVHYTQFFSIFHTQKIKVPAPLKVGMVM